MTKIWLRNLPMAVISTVVGLIVSFLVYSMFKNSLEQNGFWIIISYYISAIAVAIPFTWSKRNNPKYYAYYLTHPSKISILIILFSIPFLVLLYLYAQCRQYGVPIGLNCINLILNPPKF